MSLVSLSDLKTYLDITSTDYDTLLGNIKDGVEKLFIDISGNPIEQADYETTVYADNIKLILLPVYPVNSVASIKVDDTTIDLDNYEVYSEEGYIRFDFNVKGKVVISYNAGYSTIPMDIQEVVKQQTGLFFRNRGNIGQKSVTVGNETITQEIGILPVFIEVARRYRTYA